MLFFFSSRRRHTRWTGDWSSDVCSSDLGHAVLEYAAPWGRPVAKWEPLFGEDARDEIARLRADLVDKHGEERAARMADTNRNLLIYPNLVINDIMAITVRTFM